MKRRPARPHGRPRPNHPGAGPASRPGPRRNTGPLNRPEAPEALPAVAPPGVLADAAAAIGAQVEAEVLGRGLRADRLLASALRRRRDLSVPDQRLVSEAVFALFRWRGWVESLGPRPIEDRLMLSVLLDAPTVPPFCRVWARQLDRDPDRLIPLGDAPGWTPLAEGFKRLVGARAFNADPWRLFPAWLRDHLPLPPGDAPPKARFLAVLRAMQARPPLWVRVQGAEPQAVWTGLRDAGVRPWVHRRLPHAARLDADVDVYHLPAFVKGTLEIQDLASQVVALACDPDPGERWWDACAGAGGKALHLADLMGGKGVVVASDLHEDRLKETVRRARRSPFRNITTRAWDGRHVAGRKATFDGVLVDAPCSGIGTWRRNPDSRWTLDPAAIDRLCALQAQLLASASAGVRPGGTLLYSVCTLTPSETSRVVTGFLDAHPAFRVDPFPHPLTGTPTDGTLTIWPHEADCDGMFIARMVRSA